ncbi:MAG: YceI family protein [Beijerinckiaceae bacterium]
MRLKLIAAAAAAALLGLAAPSRAADYKLDPAHTHVLFLVDHLGFSKMTGLFADTAGTLSFDPARVEASTLTVVIKTSSLATQFGPRDADLKGADWFNVTEFPEMKFVGTKFTKKDAKTGTITGDLTLLGVSKPVTLEVTFNKAGVRPTDKADTAGFSARGSLKRSDFGLKTYLPYIGDQVDLIIETEATR